MSTISRNPGGCACGSGGEIVARRPVFPQINSRNHEFDIKHESGAVHTNVVALGSPTTLSDGSRWDTKSRSKIRPTS